MPIRPELRRFYGRDWRLNVRPRIRARAADRCEICGEQNSTWVEKQKAGIADIVEVWIQCGAAHLNNIAGDDRDENLAWLCRGCHLAYDRRHHHQTRAARKDAARPLLNAKEASL